MTDQPAFVSPSGLPLAASESRTRPSFVNGEDWILEQLASPAPAFLLRDMIMPTGMTIIGGRPKIGKSFVAYEMVLAMATGKRYGIMDPDGKRSRVGLLDLEGVARDNALRLHQMMGSRGLAGGSLQGNFQVFEQRRFNLLAADGKTDLILAMRDGGIECLFIDTFAKSYSGDENSAREVGAYLAALKEVREQTGSATVIVHHLSKSSFVARDSLTAMDPDAGLRGSSTLQGDYDNIVSLQSGFVEETDVTVLMGQGKNTAEFWHTFELETADSGERDAEGNKRTYVTGVKYGRRHDELGAFEPPPKLTQPGFRAPRKGSDE